MSAASDITRRAKSNLAFALRILPKDRRDDMVVFYAFCRTIDDLADAPDLLPVDRAATLDAWKHGILHGFSMPDAFQREFISLRDRHQLPNEILVAIIDGCRSDLQPQQFPTWEDLSHYTWKVAGAVGLISIRLFGCRDPDSEHYAITLGHALQLTNILRDIGEDYANDRRIYLPQEDLARFGYHPQDLAEHRHDDRFLALMEFEAARAETFFQKAKESISTTDRAALLPARVMASTYQELLRSMRADGFQIFQKRYRISRFRKALILAKHLVAPSRDLA